VALADWHLGATMVVMIHRNFRGKEGKIKQTEISYQGAKRLRRQYRER